MFLGGCPCCGKKDCWRCYEFGGCDVDWINHILDTLQVLDPIDCEKEYPPIVVDCSYATTANNEGVTILNPNAPIDQQVGTYSTYSFTRQQVRYIPLDIQANNNKFTWTYMPDPMQFGHERPIMWARYCPLPDPPFIYWNTGNLGTLYGPGLYLQAVRDTIGYYAIFQNFSLAQANLQSGQGGNILSADFLLGCVDMVSSIGFGGLGGDFANTVSLELETNAIENLTRGTASVSGTYPDWEIAYGEDNVTSWRSEDYPINYPLEMKAKTVGISYPETYDSTFTVYSARLEDGTDIVPGGLGE